MTEVTLEKRVTELETFVWDMPNLINMRFSRFDTEFTALRGAITDNTGRLQAVERAMTMLQTDMRDLRGGVTRQLLAQDAQLREIRAQIGGLESDVGTLKSDVGTLKSDVSELKTSVANIESGMQELLQRIPRT